jgi:hypothetical protein
MPMKGYCNRQNGGTKISKRIFAFTSKSTDWKPITDYKTISLSFLNNFVSIKKVSSESLCSMILVGRLNPDGDVKIRSQIYSADGTQFSSERRADRPRFVNDGLEQQHVCMKISLVKTKQSTVERVEWNESSTKKIRKVVTTVDEADKELERQKEMYSDLLCGRDAFDVIPDGISSYVITPKMFNGYVARIKIASQTFDDETKKVLDWIINSAQTYNLDIHIAFMDYLEGFTTLSKFFKDNTDPGVQETISYKAAAVVLQLLLKSITASWDMHSGNILTDGTDVKLIDFGRTYHFINRDDKNEIEECLNDLFQQRGHDDGLLHFFNIADLTIDLEDQFDSNYERLLKDFPYNKYIFSSFSQNDKRKQIYETLIFLAFIDGMTKKIIYDSDGFQSSSIMTRVFHNETAFQTLDQFLKYFTLDYDVFVAKYSGVVVDKLNNSLDRICEFLEPTLFECPLYKRSVGDAFRYYSDSESESESESDKKLSKLDVGGKKRKYTEKKSQIRKYSVRNYNRNKFRRTSYRIRKTERKSSISRRKH